MNRLMLRKLVSITILLLASIVSINALLAKAVLSSDKTGFSQINDFKKNSSTDQWFAWKVDLIEGRHKICCSNNFIYHSNQEKLSCICDLENKNTSSNHTIINIIQDDTSLDNESDKELIIYYKVVDGEANKLVAVSNSCKVNAKGNSILWLANISAKQSLNFLLSNYDELTSKQKGNTIEAIAYHQEESATTALIKLYKKSNTEQQQHLSLMLSMLRGEKGLEFAINQFDKAPNNSIKEELIFSISQSPLEKAHQKIISIARTNQSADIREQAIFWISQNDSRDSKETAKLIMDLINDEKSTDVRLHSVFALSQIKNGDGLDYLEKLITTSKDSEIRQQALFWLAESDEERAMPILEAILGS